jgi:hypothetical protein
MITRPATHFFEATYPTLEEGEEIIWYKHFKHPVSCNQLGMIVFDDSVSWTYNNRNQYRYWGEDRQCRTSLVLGSAERVVCECISGFSYKNKAFLYKDGNPYNKTFDNLLPYRVINTEELNEANLKWKAFLKATVDYMNSRTPLLLKRGIVPEDYWGLMNLPDWLTKVWNKDQEIPKPKKKRGTRVSNPYGKPYKIHDWKVERMEAILKLRAEGKTFKQIATHFGLNSGSAIGHWTKKYGDGFDLGV